MRDLYDAIRNFPMFKYKVGQKVYLMNRDRIITSEIVGRVYKESKKGIEKKYDVKNCDWHIKEIDIFESKEMLANHLMVEVIDSREDSGE